MSYICDNISAAKNGHLLFAGRDTVELAEKYGTPLYLMDEQRIRYNCRVYKKAFSDCFSESSLPLFASKAFCIKWIYSILAEEGFGTDVVSPGEIYTAYKAGFNLQNAWFHSNDKTDSDIRFAMDCGVGYFVIESEDEAFAVNSAASERGIVQNVLIRVTPGIDTHTYAAVNTGLVDSKFGVAIETGQADSLLAKVLTLKSLNLVGFHCHVGSSIFAEDVFERSAEIMIRFIADSYHKYGFRAQQLNLGGGYGVRYTKSDPYLDISKKISSVASAVKTSCEKYGIPVPDIFLEPGRSIVADAGMTLYTAGSMKRIPGYKNYVSVDGGMTDNPRYALYRSRYTCYDASKMNEEDMIDCDIVGRCCESGDVIQPGVLMPKSVSRGDIIAVCTTGAYNYSMASNYNRVPRPAVLLLGKDKEELIVRRESLDDLIRLDV